MGSARPSKLSKPEGSFGNILSLQLVSEVRVSSVDCAPLTAQLAITLPRAS